MASPHDPNEVDQTLAPGTLPVPRASDAPDQTGATDATPNGPAPAGETLPPPPLRIVRGSGGAISVPIRVGPPAPTASDETLPSAVASVPPALTNGPATLPLEETLAPATIHDAPAPPPDADATVGHPVSHDNDHEPDGDYGSGATYASGANHTPPPDADADATRVGGVAPGTVVESKGADPNSADPNATMAAPGSRTAGASPSDGRSHDTVPTAGAGRSKAPVETGTMVGRFALKGLHASGGLGEVFTARDTELNREVAVKRIKSRYADDPGSRRRFLTEAELTARLDHPGVVPVFGLVNDARGRPVYAMRFIRGETLKDEIDRYHQGSGAKSPGTEKTEKSNAPDAKPAEPGATAAPAPGVKEVPRTVAFRHLLSRFVSVCQAIAYAHEKGIIHRDIKPANVMVGKFGEVLVVDWGLAKSLADAPDFERVMKAAADTGFRHDPEATDLPSHMTMAGTAVGTPSFMPPEQAAGDIDKVGPRADVYSLGATLFAILAGRAPFIGKSAAETLDQVRRGAFDPPAKVNADCPKPLEAVCLKAMALKQEDRYATAQELAADVERWLSDEPVSAYQDPPLARLARWSRRHPTRVATTVSLLCAGVLAAGGIAWAVHLDEEKTAAANVALANEQKQTAAERDKAVAEEKAKNKALVQVIDEQRQTKAEKVRVEIARDLARKRYEKAVEAYGVLVNDLDKKLSDRTGMQAIRKTLLLNATEGLKKLVEGKVEGDIGADRTLVAAHRQMGEVYQLVGQTADAQVQFLEAVKIARAVKSDAVTDTTRTPEARAIEMRAADRDLARSLDRLAGIYVDLGNTKAALKEINEAIGLFEALAANKADAVAQRELADARARRSKILMERGDTGGALKDCTFALDTRQTLFNNPPDERGLTPEQQRDRARDRERDLAASFDALAGLQLRTADTKGATASATKCLEFRRALADRFPEQPDVQRELADAHVRLGEVNFDRALMTAAAKEYRAALKVLDDLLIRDPLNAGAKADRALLYGRLGHVQIRTGDAEAAVANTKKSKDECERLELADPKSAKAQRDLALARERYGEALFLFGSITEGIKECEAGLRLLHDLKRLDSESAAANLELARGWERLGDGMLALKDPKGAVDAFEQSVKIRKDALEKDRESASAKRDLAVGMYKQADAYYAAGKPALANKLSSDATRLLVGLTATNKESEQSKRDLALAYGKWGQVLADDGRSTAALLVWQTSLDRLREVAEKDRGNVQAREEEALAFERLAGFYANLGNTDQALASARKAIAVWVELKKSADTRTKAGQRRLALVMIRCGDISAEVRQLPAAKDWYTQALKEVEAMKGDPLLGPVLDLANEKLVFLEAVKAGLSNPQNLSDKSYDGVRIAALRTIALIEVRANHAPEAANAADALAAVAKTPEDLFAVARTFAGCAAATRGTESAKVSDAKRAVEALRTAVRGKFRDAEALNTPEWAEVRKRAPEFADVQAELIKLRDAGN